MFTKELTKEIIKFKDFFFPLKLLLEQWSAFRGFVNKIYVKCSFLYLSLRMRIVQHIDSIFFLSFHKGMSNKQIFSSTSQKVTDNRTNIISGSFCLFSSRGTLASSQIQSHSWLSNNTRRVLSPQSNQQPLQKCINNIHKEPSAIENIKKIHQRPCRQTPLSGPFTPGEGWQLHSPFYSIPNPLRYSIAERVRQILVNYPYFILSFIEVGLKNHTRGVVADQRVGPIVG